MGKGINVMELFAGVGGFRLGLERADKYLFKTVWANQYEPSRITQDAFQCYVHNFGGDGVNNEDINKVDETRFKEQDINLIVGGFPCFKSGTYITTDEGIKRIEDILEGDYVLTHKNRFRKVLKVMQKKKRGIYELEVMKGNKTEVTEEHPYYVREIVKNEGGEYNYGEPQWVEVKDLVKGKHYIALSEVTDKMETYQLEMQDFWKLGTYVASGKERDIVEDFSKEYKRELLKGKGLVGLQRVEKEYLERFLEGYISRNGSLINGEYILRDGRKRITYLIGQIIHKLYKRPYSIDYVDGKYEVRYMKIGEDTGEREGFYIDGMLYVPLERLEYNNGFKGTVYNFEVEEDNSYVANNLTVHNCQDYSIARTSKGNDGLVGEKGVLFWDIIRMVREIKPRHILLENVDRLLISPSKQRGRDFGIMLKVLHDLGYMVEWRILDASHYGGSQRRVRVFIYAVRDDTQYVKNLDNETEYSILTEKGFFAPNFKVRKSLFTLRPQGKPLQEDLVKVSDTFTHEFNNAGIVRDNKIYTLKLMSIREGFIPLGNILEDSVDEKYYLTEEQIEKFKYLRGSKEIPRETEDGYKYVYKEGAMTELDILDRPSRTILTGEGNVSRTSHIIEDEKGRRFLTPLECERLNNFEDNWTDTLRDRMRYFTMGNALDVSLVERMGKRIKEIELGEE